MIHSLAVKRAAKAVEDLVALRVFHDRLAGKNGSWITRVAEGRGEVEAIAVSVGDLVVVW